MQQFFNDFTFVFIQKDRWQQLLNGLGVTLEITLFSAIIGILLGFIIAIVRVAHDNTTSHRTFGNAVLNFFNALCKLYLTIFRGTPVVVQLLIIYFVIFASVDIDKIFVAVIAFGLNSAAYVAEIARSGIMSIDKGQTEAGRSLGFSYRQTMTTVILPQALKNVLPALGNEMIALLKETSVSGWIAVSDLTKGGDMIRSATYSPFLPLIAIALIYLVVVIIMTRLVSMLERRLRASDH